MLHNCVCLSLDDYDRPEGARYDVFATSPARISGLYPQPVGGLEGARPVDDMILRARVVVEGPGSSAGRATGAS